MQVATNMPGAVCFLILIGLGLSLSVSADATTYMISPDGLGDFPTIQAGIVGANSGDVLLLLDGTFSGPGNRDLDCYGLDLTIRSQSNDPMSCIIDCGGTAEEAHRAFYLHSGETSACTIQAIGMCNGYNDTGGAIAVMNESQPTIQDCYFFDNYATYGGGIHLSETNSLVTGCIFYGNQALGRGGGLDVHMASEPQVVNCTFYGNQCHYGAHLGTRHSSTTSVENCILAFGIDGEAAVCELDAHFELQCCDVYGNEGGDFADCISQWAGILGNFSDDPLLCDPYTWDFHLQEGSPCAASMNPTCGRIGAWGEGCVLPPVGYTVYPDGSGDYPTIQEAVDAAEPGEAVLLGDGVFTGPGNRDIDFGGKAIILSSISGDAELCIIDCEATSELNGRALIIDDGEDVSTLIKDITFRGGYMIGSMDDQYGGAVWIANGAAPRFIGCHFEANHAIFGGALACRNGEVSLNYCLFYQNDAILKGGGIDLSGTAEATVSNVTIVACEAYYGAGIDVVDDAQVLIQRTIISSCLTGGAVMCENNGGAAAYCCNFFDNEGGDWIDCLASWEGTEGNVSTNPLFCNEDGGEFHLLPGAPGDPQVNTECGLVGGLLVGCTGEPPAEPYQIAADGSGDFATIQEAIDRVGTGATLQLADGVYTGEGNRDLQVSWKDITIEAASGSPSGCIIECAGSEFEEHVGVRVGELYAGALELRNVTIQNAYVNGPGGAVRSFSCPVTLEGCVLADNHAFSGGAVEGSITELIVDSCTFTGNSADDSGGAIHLSGASSLAMDLSSFSVNSSVNRGGALSLIGNVSTQIDSSSFEENMCLWGTGGAIHLGNDQDCELTFCTLLANLAPMGGAVSLDSTSATLTNLTMSENVSDHGAGLYIVEGTSMIENSIIAFSGYGDAVTCASGYDIALACCDLYGNAGGDWTGYIEWMENQLGNISEDPLFCLEQGDFPYAITLESPCTPYSYPNEECELIGAWASGCGDAAMAGTGGGDLPRRLVLAASQPNPFSSMTTIGYAIPAALHRQVGALELFDVQGRMIRELKRGPLEAGIHRVAWDGRDERGEPVGQGTYFYRLKAGQHSKTQKLVCIR